MKIPQRYLQNRISNIRQDYATINKSIVDKLNPPNLYRFFCLSLYRNDYYKVRWRIKDLAKRTGEEETALKNFNKDIEAVLVRKRYPVPINHPLIDFTMRSLYCIPPIDRPNFITLSYLFIKVDFVFDFEDTLSDEEAEERSVREARMWTAIDALPERCREIFLLNKRDGMKYREIAAKFQISVNTVDNHISKALRLIREGTQKVYAFLFN